MFRLFHASAADGTYTSASRIPVTICSISSVNAALPKTYHQLAVLRGTLCSTASLIGPSTCNRCSNQS
jgi:hypothetical protein